MLNLLRLHQLAREGDGLDPALHAVLSRRAAIESNPKITVLHPGLAFGDGEARRVVKRRGKGTSRSTG